MPNQPNQPQEPTTPRGAKIPEPTIESVDQIRKERRQQEIHNAPHQNNINPIPLNLE